MTVLLREESITDEIYYRHYNHSWRIWLLFIPLYLAGAGLFIWWMGRKIGRPLRRLNDAVVSQSEGRVVRVGNCGGPREIRLIGESFDRFSDRLAESEAERRRLDQGRQKLIADISHDLKTPITVIAGYIDAICDGKVPPEEVNRYLRAIQGKSEALTELVNAFHEYSKVEHPEFVLHKERTDLCEFLREYLAGKYDEIDLAGFTLEVSIPEHPVLCALDQLAVPPGAGQSPVQRPTPQSAGHRALFRPDRRRRAPPPSGWPTTGRASRLSGPGTSSSPSWWAATPAPARAAVWGCPSPGASWKSTAAPYRPVLLPAPGAARNLSSACPWHLNK